MATRRVQVSLTDGGPRRYPVVAGPERTTLPAAIDGCCNPLLLVQVILGFLELEPDQAGCRAVCRGAAALFEAEQ